MESMCLSMLGHSSRSSLKRSLRAGPGSPELFHCPIQEQGSPGPGTGTSLGLCWDWTCQVCCLQVGCTLQGPQLSCGPEARAPAAPRGPPWPTALAPRLRGLLWMHHKDHKPYESNTIPTVSESLRHGDVTVHFQVMG